MSRKTTPTLLGSSTPTSRVLPLTLRHRAQVSKQCNLTVRNKSDQKTNLNYRVRFVSTGKLRKKSNLKLRKKSGMGVSNRYNRTTGWMGKAILGVSSRGSKKRQATSNHCGG